EAEGARFRGEGTGPRPPRRRAGSSRGPIVPVRPTPGQTSAIRQPSAFAVVASGRAGENARFLPSGNPDPPPGRGGRAIPPESPDAWQTAPAPTANGSGPRGTSPADRPGRRRSLPAQGKRGRSGRRAVRPVKSALRGRPPPPPHGGRPAGLPGRAATRSRKAR